MPHADRPNRATPTLPTQAAPRASTAIEARPSKPSSPGKAAGVSTKARTIGASARAAEPGRGRGEAASALGRGLKPKNAPLFSGEGSIAGHDGLSEFNKAQHEEPLQPEGSHPVSVGERGGLTGGRNVENRDTQGHVTPDAGHGAPLVDGDFHGGDFTGKTGKAFEK